jgi:hypothetical protein
MRKRVTIFLIALLIIPVLYAQQVISSAGTSGTIPGYQLSWTVGEPVISTFTGTNATLTQGFHQTKLIVTSLDVVMVSDLKFSVYPNPTEDIIFLKTAGNTNTTPLYSMYNAGGKMIMSGKTGKDIISIDMQKNVSGIYFLKIISEKGELLQSFKILKQ